MKITADQIRELRERGPRTIEYLNNCDLALAALRGEYGAGEHRAEQALAWCAEQWSVRFDEPSTAALYSGEAEFRRDPAAWLRRQRSKS